MKLEFSYTSGKNKYRIILIINILIIVLLFSLNLITNNYFFFNFSLFMCFWLIFLLIGYFIINKYSNKYLKIINNGNKIIGEITRCYKECHRHRMLYDGVINVQVDYGDRYYSFKDIVYNKKFKELESKVEEIWNKKRNNWTYKGRFEITLYELNGELAADLDSIKFVEE